jgi:hypothetical protein
MNRLQKESGRRLRRRPESDPKTEGDIAFFGCEITNQAALTQEPPTIEEWVNRHVLSLHTSPSPEEYWRAVHGLAAMERRVRAQVPQQAIDRVIRTGRPTIFGMAGDPFEKFEHDEGLGAEDSDPRPQWQKDEEWRRRGRKKEQAKAQQQARREPEENEEQVFQELLAKYSQAICAFEKFKNLPIAPRKLLMGRWMKEGDTGFIYGPPGAGKSWLVDAIAVALSRARELFDWKVPEAVNVAFLDGEMPFDEARDRFAGLEADPERLIVLHHEALFSATDRPGGRQLVAVGNKYAYRIRLVAEPLSLWLEALKDDRS